MVKITIFSQVNYNNIARFNPSDPTETMISMILIENNDKLFKNLFN